MRGALLVVALGAALAVRCTDGPVSSDAGAPGGLPDAESVDTSEAQGHGDASLLSDAHDMASGDTLDATIPLVDAGSDTGEDAPIYSDADASTSPDTGWPCPPQSPGSPGPFRRDGDSIVDSLGRAIILHGANVSNTTKHSQGYMTWHGPEDFADLASIGLNHVRLLVQWAGVSPEKGAVDEPYLDALAERVDWAAQAGLLVILDMHQDVFGYGFGGNGAPRWACDEALYAAHQPKEPWYRNYLSAPVQACFDRLYTDDATFAGLRDAWVAVAGRFADHPAVLGFDLLNEPHWGTHPAETFVSDIWQRRQEELAAAIRAVAPGRIVWFQGTTLVSMGAVQPFAPACHGDTGYAPHYYHPLVHDGYPYAPPLKPQVVLALDAISASAGNLGGVPVWLGEIGAFPNAPTTPAYLHDLLSLLAERRWGWAWWADDRSEGGFALRHADGTFQEAVVDIVGHPYARRIPGALLSQSMDFAADLYVARFAWTIEGPLEVWTGGGVVTVGTDGGDLVPCVQGDGSLGVVVCGPPDTLGVVCEVRVER